jgi:hypothetical protein
MTNDQLRAALELRISTRLVSVFTSHDLGSSYPPPSMVLNGIKDFHESLLLRAKGQMANLAGGLTLTPFRYHGSSDLMA